MGLLQGGHEEMSSTLAEPKCGGWRGVDCRVSANEYSCAHGAQMNLEDLTPHLTYGLLEQLPSVPCVIAMVAVGYKRRR
jgi:hypothetical protein